MATTDVIERASAVGKDAGSHAHGVERAPRPGIRLSDLYTVLFALGGWLVGSGKLADNSFFTHLLTGRLILDRGIPHADPYSFTAPGVHWISQSWLAELAYASIDKATGAAGIRVFHGLIGAAIGVVVFRLALRLSGDRTRALALSIPAMMSISAMWSPRPLVIAALLLLVLVWLVEVPDSWMGRHELVVVPALVWVWANVHGTFVIGLAYLGLHLAGRWIDGHAPWEGRERRLLVAAAIAFAVCFLNPYGPGLVLFPLQLLGRGDVLSHVKEWRSPDFREWQGQMLALWLVVFVVIVARARNRVSRRDLVVAIPFVVLTFWAQRNIVLIAIVTLPILARAIATSPLSAGASSDEARLPVRNLLAVVVIGFVVLAGIQIAREPAFALQGNPVRAMRVLERDGLLGSRLMESDGWGGYVMLRYWPEQRVFMDDRFDMYPTSFLKQYFATSELKPGWQAMLRRYDVETVVWPTDNALAQALAESPDWVRVHRDHTASLFVRRDVAARHGLT